MPTFREELATLALPSLQFVNYRSGLLSLHSHVSQLLLSLFICACVGILCFIVLGFIALHRCYIFYKLKARLSTSKKDYHSLYCDTCFTVVTWNWTSNNSRYASLSVCNWFCFSLKNPNTLGKAENKSIPILPQCLQ